MKTAPQQDLPLEIQTAAAPKKWSVFDKPLFSVWKTKWSVFRRILHDGRIPLLGKILWHWIYDKKDKNGWTTGEATDAELIAKFFGVKRARIYRMWELLLKHSYLMGKLEAGCKWAFKAKWGQDEVPKGAKQEELPFLIVDSCAQTDTPQNSSCAQKGTPGVAIGEHSCAQTDTPYINKCEIGVKESVEGEKPPQFEPLKRDLYRREYEEMLAFARSEIEYCEKTDYYWEWETSQEIKNLLENLRSEGKSQRADEIEARGDGRRRTRMKLWAVHVQDAWVRREREIINAMNGIV